MSQENIEIVRRAYDALNRHDLATVLAFTDPDVVVRPRILSVEGGTLRGHEGVRTWWDGLSSTFPDLNFEVIEVRGVDDDVTVANIQVRGHGEGSGAPFVDDVWHACRLRNGKVIWWQTFDSERAAL